MTDAQIFLSGSAIGANVTLLYVGWGSLEITLPAIWAIAALVALFAIHLRGAGLVR